jgi:NAD+ kinase
MKDIAVVYKYSALESYSPRQIRRHRELNPELTQRMHLAHEEHARALESLRRVIAQLGAAASYFERDTLSRSLDEFRLVISFGGDGTFINASHFIDKTLLLGVNSSPDNSVGHYCRYELRTQSGKAALRRDLQALLESSPGRPAESQLMRLKVTLHDRPAPFPVLNDVLFSEQNPAATSRYTLCWRNRVHHQKSSGLWVTTPTGSTAAYASAGGKPFTRRELRFIVRELYSDAAPRRLTHGSVRAGETLRIISSMMHGALWLDGSHYRMPVALGEHITIGIHPQRLRAIY